MGEDHEDYCLREYTYQFNPELLKGQVAFITGGGSGIGFRIAELFMRHGCDTVIASRNATRLEEVGGGGCRGGGEGEEVWNVGRWWML